MRSLALALVAFSRAGAASPVETFGLLPADQARAGVGVADGDTAAAAALNPAATALGDRPEAALAYAYQHLALSLRDAPAALTDAHGTTAAVGVPFRWGPIGLGASAALHVPDDDLLAISLAPPSRARWVMFDNRIHRVVIDAALSVALGPRLSFGVGASILVDGAGHGISFRVGAAPSRTVAEGALDVSLPWRAAPTVGILFRPSPWLSLGLRATGALSFAVALNVNASASVPGSGLDGDAVLSVRGVDHYTPAELCAGARFSLSSRLRAGVELAYRAWSRAPSPSSEVGLSIQIGASPPTLSASVPAPGYRDIVIPRASIEAELSRVFTLRAGYSYVPTPVPAQTGFTSYADADRHLVALGATFALGSALGATFALDLAAQWHHAVDFVARKRDPLTPGGDLTGGGDIVGASAALRARW